MKQTKLTDEALVALNKPLNGQGGWQNLIKKLQGQCNAGILSYDGDDFKNIKKYAEYGDGEGGYQGRFNKILFCLENT